MGLLTWDRKPQLVKPVLVAAFEGWNDAGNAASDAVAYLSRAWGATSFACFDSEELFDFTSSRPHVRIESGETRKLEWPSVTLASAPLTGEARDVVLLYGPEPQLRWRSFTNELCEAALQLGITTAVLLGALLADVPHTRPVRISGGAATSDLAALAHLEPSYYEGPTGILGVVADALGRSGIPTASLWASVPHYVSQSSSPKAALALVERAALLVGSAVDVAELEISSAAYERQVNELVASDDDAAAYVSRLEEQDEEDRDEPVQLAQDDVARLLPASGERLAAEVERYLREHRRD